jgi:hypothetical protein
MDAPPDEDFLAALRAAFWAAAWDTLGRYCEGLPAPAAGVDRAGCLPSHLWKDLDPTNRVTLSYWLLRRPAYRAALCLSYELDEPPGLVRAVLGQPSAGALDILMHRARLQFRRYYRRLESLQSPPFPAILSEALTGRAATEMAEGDKASALASALEWLRAYLRDQGGN